MQRSEMQHIRRKRIILLEQGKILSKTKGLKIKININLKLKFT